MSGLNTLASMATIGSFCIELPRVGNGIHKFSDNTLNLAAQKVDQSFCTLEYFYNLLDAAEVDRCMTVYDKNKKLLERAAQNQKSLKKLESVLTLFKQRKSNKIVLRNAELFEKLVNRTSLDARERHMRSKGKNTCRTVPPGAGPACENATQLMGNQIPLQVINSSVAENNSSNSTEHPLSLEEARILLRCPGCGSAHIPKSAYSELSLPSGSQQNHTGAMTCDDCGISRLPPPKNDNKNQDTLGI